MIDGDKLLSRAQKALALMEAQPDSLDAALEMTLFVGELKQYVMESPARNLQYAIETAGQILLSEGGLH